MFACHSSINLPSSLNPFLGLCAFLRTVTHRGGGAFFKGVTMKEKPDLTGMKFGRWTVISKSPKRNHWLCRCECGVLKTRIRNVLTNGSSKSCGCSKNVTHGMTKTDEHNIWLGIKRRCYNPHANHYDRYGGRGITVCERWRESFINFYIDMGTRPSKNHSIHRINNDGDYEPSNCRWATLKEQQRNTIRSRWLTFRGITMTSAEWAEKLGIRYGLLTGRLRKGWDVEKCLMKPNQYWPR